MVMAYDTRGSCRGSSSETRAHPRAGLVGALVIRKMTSAEYAKWENQRAALEAKWTPAERARSASASRTDARARSTCSRSNTP
jgi:hypothetical protein